MTRASNHPKEKRITWPKPWVFLLVYFLMIGLVVLLIWLTKDPNPWTFILITPILVAGFHYSRTIYWSMAFIFAGGTNLVLLALYPGLLLLPLHQVIVVVSLTTGLMAEAAHAFVSAQIRTEQALRNSEQSYRALVAIAERQAQELSLLDHVRTAMASELDPKQLYRILVENIVKTFGYTQVSIYQREDEEMILQYQVGYPSVIPRIPLSQGIIGRVASTGQSVLVKDVHNEPAFLGAAQGVVSEVCVPIFDRQDHNKVLAVLNVESSQGISLGEADLQLMKGLSLQVGIAIARANLYGEVKNSEERFRTLVENEGEGVAIIDEDEFFRFANPAAEAIFGVPPGTLVGRNVKEFSPPEKIPFLIEQTENRRTGKKTSYEFEINRADGERRSLLVTGTPQIDQVGNFTGTLAVFYDISDRKKMEEELRYLSTHDALTGLYNRSYFETELTRLQSGRHFPISIFVVDVDGMKNINDHYGHSAGDELLKRAARVLRSAFRSEDVVARIGGDEFSVLVPEANHTVALAALGRLEGILSRHNQENPTIPLRLSIGMATGEASSVLSDVVKQADSLMYTDKLSHHSQANKPLFKIN